MGRGSRGLGHGHEPPDEPGAVQVDHLDEGAQLVGQIHRNRFPAPGEVDGQREHVADDGVGLPLGEVGAQGPGVPEGELRVVETLVARVGVPVGGIVEVEVVEKPGPGGGPRVPAELFRHAVGDVGDEQRVLVTGGGIMPPPLLHGVDLLAFQQRGHAFQIGGLLGMLHG